MPKHIQGDSTTVVYPPAPKNQAVFFVLNSNGDVRYLTPAGGWTGDRTSAKRMTLMDAMAEARDMNRLLTGSNHYHLRGVCTL